MAPPIALVGAHLEPAKLPGAWKRLRTHQSFVRIADSSALLADLLAEGLPEELAATGIVRGEPGSFVLHPVFAENPRCVFVGTSTKGDPETLVGDKDCFGSSQPAWLTPLRDKSANPLLAQCDSLVLTRNIIDACLLWSAGVLATVRPAGPMTSTFLDELANLKSAVLKRGGHMGIIVADWSVSRLSIDQDPATDMLLDHLQKMQKYIAPELDLKRWRPAAECRERLEFLLRFGSLRNAVSVLVGSLKTAAVIKPAQPPVRHVTYEESRGQFMEAVATHSSKIGQARRELRAAIRREYSQPLLQSAKNAAAPEERAISTIAAEGVEAVHLGLVEMAARPYDASDVDGPKALNTVLRNAEQIRRLLTPLPEPNARKSLWGKIT